MWLQLESPLVFVGLRWSTSLPPWHLSLARAQTLLRPHVRLRMVSPSPIARLARWIGRVSHSVATPSLFKRACDVLQVSAWSRDYPEAWSCAEISAAQPSQEWGFGLSEEPGSSLRSWTPDLSHERRASSQCEWQPFTPLCP